MNDSRTAFTFYIQIGRSLYSKVVHTHTLHTMYPSPRTFLEFLFTILRKYIYFRRKKTRLGRNIISRSEKNILKQIHMSVNNEQK